jgi:hypothetical protein
MDLMSPCTKEEGSAMEPMEDHRFNGGETWSRRRPLVHERYSIILAVLTEEYALVEKRPSIPVCKDH